MQQPSTAIEYRPEIDGLRALAVALVVMFHAGLGMPGGFVGVDIFFVISGFLITSRLLKDIAAGTISLAGFYERRARRIVPASIVMTALVLLAGAVWVLPWDYGWVGLSALAHTLGVANVFFVRRTADYFAESAAEMPLLHTWSLAVEEQFYLLFPLLLIAVHRFARRHLRSTLVAVAAASLVLSIYGMRVEPNSTFYLLPTRAWELLIGVILATFFQAATNPNSVAAVQGESDGVSPAVAAPRAGSRAGRVLGEIASWAALAFMVVPALCYSPATPFPGLAAVPPCVGAGLLIGSRGGAVVGRVLASGPMVFVGAISYSLYLYHWPVLVLANYWRVAPLPLSGRLTLVAVSVALAIASWWVVERPFRLRTVCRTRRAMFVASATGLAAIVVATGVVWRTGGVPARVPTAVNEIDAIRREPLHLAQLQAADVRSDRLTPMGVTDPAAPVSVLLWGDSHAGAFYPAFHAWCGAHGLLGRAATHSAVAPLLDYAIEGTAAHRSAMIEYNASVVDYVARKRIKTVFLVNYWQRNLKHDPQRLVAALKRTIAALQQAGATVYVVMQVPGYAVDVPKFVAGDAWGGRAPAGWRKTFGEHRQEQAVMYRLARQLESADCHFIDPARHFQRRGEPYLTVVDRDRCLYHDGHHLTPWGARRMLRACLEADVGDLPR